MNASIKLLENLNVKILYINSNYYFSFSDLNYCVMPKEFRFLHLGNIISFTCNNNLLEKKFIKFIKLFKSCSQKSQKPFAKKLILKGLGLKANLSNNNSILELKLGFSHLVKILIPKPKVFIKLFKHTIIVYGSNLVTVKNFMFKIKNFKSPNIYKGKGIWYKNETKLLKPVKKN